MTYSENKKFNRRAFINKGLRYAFGVGIGAIGIAAAANSSKQEMVWQLDPSNAPNVGAVLLHV
jgi:hypothetical protein